MWYLKGAVDRVLPMCSWIYSAACEERLSDSTKADIMREAQKIGRTGLRGKISLCEHVTIVFAFFAVVALCYGRERDRNYVYAGMVGILDPPRVGVREAIMTMHGASVDIKMITGDSEETAESVGIVPLL